MTETQQTTTTTVEKTETHDESRTSSLLTDILTIIGFAILFIIILWGFIHLVSLVSSSLFSKHTAPTIEVTAPAEASSGQPVVVSWNYTPSTQGSYAFLYQCQNGLSFETKGATSSMTSIPCGSAYTVGNASNSLTLTPVLSATSAATDTVSIVFIPSKNGSEVQGDATMVINPAAKPTPVKTAPKPSGPTYTAPQDDDEKNGKPDYREDIGEKARRTTLVVGLSFLNGRGGCLLRFGHRYRAKSMVGIFS